MPGRRNGASGQSTDARRVGRLMAAIEAGDPADSIPGPAGPPLVSLVFRRADLGPVRRVVARVATQAGLFGTRLQSFVLAVNEITTNAVLHGGGRGRLRLWRAGPQLVCEITDAGPGLPDGQEAPEVPPPPDATHGRGLWLTRTLCDRFTLHSTGNGTTVRLAAVVDGPG